MPAHTALAQTMTNVSSTTKEMMRNVNTAADAQAVLNKALQKTSLSAKLGSVVMKAFSVAVNVAFTFLMSRAISAVYNMITAQQKMRESAKEIGGSLKDEQTTIQDYKKKIIDLYKTINNSTSSLDQVRKAREDLMSIQDELIAKYGIENGVVENITKAIDGQADSLDNLSRKEYFKAKNKFNAKPWYKEISDWWTSNDGLRPKAVMDRLTALDFTGVWDAFTLPTSDNMSQLIQEMEHCYFELSDTGNEALDSLISSTYDLAHIDGKFRLYGGLEKIYEILTQIQEISQNFATSDVFETSFAHLYNSVGEKLSEYQNLYNNYILQEKIFNSQDGLDYESDFDKINQAADAYNKAKALNDRTAIKQTSADYAQAVSNAMANALSNNDENVATYFQNMYPSLKHIVGEWEFESDFTMNTDNIRKDLEEAMSGMEGLHSEDIMSLYESGKFDDINKLYEIANQYGLTFAQLIHMLEKEGIITSKAYEDLHNIFGNRINELSDQDLEYAYIVSDGTIKTWDELLQRIEKYKKELLGIPLISDVFAFKDEFGTSTELGNLSDELDNIQAAASGLNDIMKSYNDSGKLSIDQLQQLLSYGDSYLAYLIDENGSLNLNKQALTNVAYARIQEMKAKVLGSLVDNITSITDETEALSYLEDQLFDTARGYQEYSKQDIANWYITSLKKGNISKEVLLDVKNTADKQFDAISQFFDSIDYSSLFSDSDSAASQAAADLTQILEAELNLLDLKMDNGLIGFQTYVNDRTALIQKYYDQGKISADKYYDYLNSNYDKQLSYMDKVISAVTRRFDKEIDSLKDTISGIEAENDSLNQLIDNYDTVISVVNDVYEAEQDALRAQQDAIQKKIDALKEANEEQEKEIALEKAKYSLEQAQTQRTRLVFDSETKQFVYKQDTSAIRDAQKEVDNLETEAKIDDLQKEKDSIQVKIDKLDELKAKWNEISSVYKIHQNQLIAQEILGKNYEQIILSGRIEDVEAFQQRYVAAQQQINDNEAMIASYNERIEYYELQKQQWSDIADTYEQSVTDQVAAMILGQDWESKVLSGRQQTLEDFKNNYIRIQTEMTQSAIENANKQVEAFTNAANNTITSGIAEKETYKVVGNKDTVYKTGFATQQEANNWIAEQEDKKRYSSSILRSLRVVPEYHSGLLGNYPGLTPDSRYNTLKTLGTRRLSSDEFLALLRKKELVYTQEQQDTTLSNLSSLTDSFLNNQFGRISKFSTPASLPSGSVSSCTFTTGDIQLYGVQDVYSMAEQIKKQFHNVMYQRLKMS